MPLHLLNHSTAEMSENNRPSVGLHALNVSAAIATRCPQRNFEGDN